MPIPATITVLGQTVKTKNVAGAALVAGLGYYLFFTNSGKAFVRQSGLTGRHSQINGVGASALPASGY